MLSRRGARMTRFPLGLRIFAKQFLKVLASHHRRSHYRRRHLRSLTAPRLQDWTERRVDQKEQEI